MAKDYFDFNHVMEEDEGLDFQKLKPCSRCKKPIPHNAAMCLYCGEAVSYHRQRLWIVWVAMLLLIVLAALALLY